METPATNAPLSMPWWEFAGRIAVGVPFLLSGAAFLAVQAARLADPQSVRFLMALMSVFGGILALAGLSALAGRMLLPLLVNLLYLATPLLHLLLPASARAPARPSWAALLPPLLATAWILARYAALWRPAPRLLRALACGAAAGTLLLVPGTARLLAESGASFFLPPRVEDSYGVGDRVGPIRFALPEGGSIRLDEGETVYVVNFWAAWCGPCVAELPEFLRLQEEWAGEGGVRFLAVNTEEGLDWEAIGAFLEERGLEGLAVSRDTRGLFDRLGLDTIPVTLVIRDQRIRARIDGYHRDLEETLRKEIRSALPGGRAGSPGQGDGQDLPRQG